MSKSKKTKNGERKERGKMEKYYRAKIGPLKTGPNRKIV